MVNLIVTSFLASMLEQTLELVEVREATTRLVEGEVIQFEAGGEKFELLVGTNQEVRIVEGHSALLGRTILSIRVGDQLDVKEKIF